MVAGRGGGLAGEIRVKFLRTQSGELVVDGANARMRKVLADHAKREKLADFIVNGHDGSQIFTRADMKTLEPGESRTYKIEIGSVEISKN